jgi:hypothetical protein
VAGVQLMPTSCSESNQVRTMPQASKHEIMKKEKYLTGEVLLTANGR